MTWEPYLAFSGKLMAMPKGSRRVWALSALAVGCIAVAGWWGWTRLAAVPAVPARPPDEGQEEALHAGYLEALVARRPDHWQARMNLAAAYMQSGDPVRGLGQIRIARNVRPRDPVVLQALAVTSHAAGSLGDEVRAWSELSRLYPTQPEPRVRLAAIYRELGWIGSARATVSAALKLDPRNADGLRLLAILDFLSQDDRAAAAAARRILAIEPGSGVAHSMLAACYRLQENWPEAFRESEAAIRAEPQTAQFFVDLAQLHMDRPGGGDPAQAIAILRAARPPDAEGERLCRYWTGVLRFRAGQLDPALADLLAVHREDPEFEQVAYYLGKAYQQKGDSDRSRPFMRAYQTTFARRMAVRDSQSALRRNIGSPDAHLRAARALLNDGQVDKAKFEAETVLRLRPGDSGATRLLAEVAAARDDTR